MDQSQYPVLASGVIHFDVSSAFPLHKDVIRLAEECMKNYAGAYGKSQHKGAMLTKEIVDQSRKSIAKLINAHEDEIYFVPSGTNALNMIALELIKPSSIIAYSPEDHLSLVKAIETHKPTKVCLDYAQDGVYELENLRSANVNTMFISSMHHLYGVDNYLQQIRSIQPKAKMVVDASQSISRMPTDVQKINCDYLIFSAEKIGGLGGVGVLYKSNKNKNDFYGKDIDMHSCPVVAIAALGKAAEILMNENLILINKKLANLTAMMLDRLSIIPGIEFSKGIAYSDGKCHGNGIVSFKVDGYDSKDVAMILDDNKIQVRAGDHCIDGDKQSKDFVRVSMYTFTKEKDVQNFIKVIKDL